MNIKRSLFAVWQEYQGLGLLGGMGHAAALPREIVVLLLSRVLPQSLIRYVLTFVMLLAGSIGTYLLVFDYIRIRKQKELLHQIIALIAGLFLIVSPLIQHLLAVPYEAFIVHIAALPLLIWSARRVLYEPTKRHLLWFTIINIVFATYAYIPTLFITYSLLLFVLIITEIFIRRTKRTVTAALLIIAITICTNAYWLFPFVYFAKTQSDVTVNAKINQMATSDTFLRNKAYGTLHKIIMQQSFWIDTFDFSPNDGKIVPITTYWFNVKDRIDYIVIGYGVAVVMAIGLIGMIVKKRTELYFLIPALLLCLTMLATDTPPFSVIGQSIRTAIPLFNQAFRFPFTKWGIATAWVMSLLFAMGIAEIVDSRLFHKHIKNLALLIFLLPICWYGYPLATNQLFYSAMRENIPSMYTDLFLYMKTKPNGRIANFPQYTYWGWSYYRWGYTGSGFPWYGIEQPLLDRAFDVWSSQDENFYWELSYALYAKNFDLVANILDKYDVQYILYDKSIISASHDRPILEQDYDSILRHLNKFSVEKIFGDIVLLTRNVPQSNQFIAISKNLPSTNSEKWNDHDQSYIDVGTYKTATPADIYYPFASLFTKRSVDERTFNVSQQFSGFSITSNAIPDSFSNDKYYLSLMKGMQASESAVTIENGYAVISDRSMPLVVGKDDISTKNVISCGLSTSGTLKLANTQHSLIIKTQHQKGCLSFLVPSLEQKYGYLVKVMSKNESGQPFIFSVINQTAKHTEIESYLPQGNQWQTSYFILPPLASDGLGYNFYISSESVGREETVNELGEIDIYRIPYDQIVETKLVKNGFVSQPAQIFPPYEVDHPNPSYYSFPINNIPADRSTVILFQSYHSGWKAYALPECRMQSVKCKIKMGLPFLFGRQLQDHVLVNNWANGWELEEDSQTVRQSDSETKPSSRTIVLFFLPQLLEWIGFAFLPLPFLFLLKRSK